MADEIALYDYSIGQLEDAVMQSVDNMSVTAMQMLEDAKRELAEGNTIRAEQMINRAMYVLEFFINPVETHFNEMVA